MSYREISPALPGERLLALLNYLYLLLMMLVIAAILTTAMMFQYVRGEVPCPLCLLERAALFGVCFGIMQNFRYGFSYRFTGISLVFSLLLLIVATRQTLLDIYPRPGHAYVGSAVFGLHMPVWSILIALALLGAYAIKMAIIGGDEFLQRSDPRSFPVINTIAGFLSVFVIVLLAINFGSAILQCGLGECHTYEYKLLPWVHVPATP